MLCKIGERGHPARMFHRARIHDSPFFSSIMLEFTTHYSSASFTELLAGGCLQGESTSRRL